MKRNFFVVLLLISIVSLSACGIKNNVDSVFNLSVNDNLYIEGEQILIINMDTEHEDATTFKSNVVKRIDSNISRKLKNI